MYVSIRQYLRCNIALEGPKSDECKEKMHRVRRSKRHIDVFVCFETHYGIGKSMNEIGGWVRGWIDEDVEGGGNSVNKVRREEGKKQDFHDVGFVILTGLTY